MKTYQLEDGMTLVVSVDGGAWETVTFTKADFADIAQATPEEVAAVIARHDLLEAEPDGEGSVVIRSATRGSSASLDVDVERSTAAAVLGLAGAGRAVGSGLQPARLISPAAELFPIPAAAELTVLVDGKRRKIAFDGKVTTGAATADEIVKAINARRVGVARPTRDGRVMLTSPSIGPDSSLEVQPSTDPAKPDAAAVLGFVGAASVSRPHTAEPATLRCTGPRTGLAIANLTAAPIELHLPSGPLLAPAGRIVGISADAAAHPALQRLIAQGAIRLLPAVTE